MGKHVNNTQVLEFKEDLTPIRSSDVDQVWRCVEPLLQTVLDRPEVNGHFTTEDVKGFVQSRDMQLWLVPGGMWITRVVQYPRARALELFAVAGEYTEEWLTVYLETLKEWGRQTGCSELEMFGRDGWHRMCGFERSYTAYRLNLNEETR